MYYFYFSTPNDENGYQIALVGHGYWNVLIEM